MKKERLTLRQCQEDLNALLQIDYSALSLPVLAMALMSFGIFGLVWSIDFREGAFLAAIPLIPLTVLMVQALGVVNRAKHLQSCTFEVVEDQLYSISVDKCLLMIANHEPMLCPFLSLSSSSSACIPPHFSVGVSMQVAATFCVPLYLHASFIYT